MITTPEDIQEVGFEIHVAARRAMNAVCIGQQAIEKNDMEGAAIAFHVAITAAKTVIEATEKISPACPAGMETML